MQEEASEETANGYVDILNQLRAINQRLGGIELVLKWLMNIDKLQDDRISDLNTMFAIIVKYIHNIDISLGDAKAEPARLRRYKSWAFGSSSDTLVVTPMADPLMVPKGAPMEVPLLTPSMEK